MLKWLRGGDNFELDAEAHIPVEIFHLKVSGAAANWGKAPQVISKDRGGACSRASTGVAAGHLRLYRRGKFFSQPSYRLGT